VALGAVRVKPHRRFGHLLPLEETMNHASLEELPFEECLRMLRSEKVGRIAVVVDEFPIVLPVNYRLVEQFGRNWLAIRTRPGNVLDLAPMPAAFEIDGIDLGRQCGWSVVVRGMLQHVDANVAAFTERFDPEPWLDRDRDSWLVIEPFAITGRALRQTEFEWAFHEGGYL
jgi:uncharacterized protein